MPDIYLMIRPEFERLGGFSISCRIRTILNENGAKDAEIYGSIRKNYDITNIPYDAAEPVYYRMKQEPGFDPHLFLGK